MSLKMSDKVNMAKNISHTAYSKTSLDYQTAVVLKETVALLIELKQIPPISERSNKKRKKDNSSGSGDSVQKKTKVYDKKANQDNNAYKLSAKGHSLSSIKDKTTFKKKKILETNFMNKKEMVKQYIDKNGKRPSSTDKNKDIQHLGQWIVKQQKNFKKKENIMKDDKIYNEWNKFINEYEEYFKSYKEYFKSYEEIWYNTLNKIKEYIDNNKKRPYEGNKNIEIKHLARWISTQQTNYIKKEQNTINDKIYCEWKQFINEY